jgi:AcrR family transcriptional regulator
VSPAGAGSRDGPGGEEQHRRDTGQQTHRGHTRRADLLLAAREVFARAGFPDARVSDIAAEAGVSQGTFYTYFDSKDAIFQAVAADVADRMLSAVGASGQPSTDLHGEVREATRRFIAAYRNEARLIVFIAQRGQSTPEVAGLWLSVRDAFIADIALGIRRHQARGLADPHVDPDLAAEVLSSMVDETCWVWLNLGRELDEERVLDALTSVCTRTLRMSRTAHGAEPGLGLADGGDVA